MASFYFTPLKALSTIQSSSEVLGLGLQHMNLGEYNSADNTTPGLGAQHQPADYPTHSHAPSPLISKCTSKVTATLWNHKKEESMEISLLKHPVWHSTDLVIPHGWGSRVGRMRWSCHLSNLLRSRAVNGASYWSLVSVMSGAPFRRSKEWSSLTDAVGLLLLAFKSHF